MRSELLRKLFHCLGFIYVLGLAMLSRPHFLGVLILLWLVVSILEYLRLKNRTAHMWLHKIGGNLFREKEQQHLSGVWWMLLGVFSSSVLLSSFHLAATPIVYLLLGDSAASLAGKFLGGPKWPHSNKTIIGSTACFAVCLAVGFVLLYSQHGGSLVVVGACAATLLEASPARLNDNFLIPLGTSLVLKLWV